jgi:hypothetical protein
MTYGQFTVGGLYRRRVEAGQRRRSPTGLMCFQDSPNPIVNATFPAPRYVSVAVPFFAETAGKLALDGILKVTI